MTLLATGSEVSIAMDARAALAAEGIHAAVVSMPCWKLFERQDEAYRSAVLGSAPRVGVEAAVRFGWDRWLGHNSAFIGMDGFGASFTSSGTLTWKKSQGKTAISASAPAIA